MELSGEEDFKKVEEGLNLLTLNYRRVVSKYVHLKESLTFLEDELVLFQNSLQVVNALLKELKVEEEKKKEVKGDEHDRSAKPGKKAER